MKQFIVRNKRVLGTSLALLLVGGIAMSFQDSPFSYNRFAVPDSNEISTCKQDTVPEGKNEGSIKMKDFDKLQAELDRADVVAPEEIPPNVVTMNSTVQFTIAETGKDFCLTLVYPRDMDGSADRVSIFAPVGSALLGLSVGDELAWPGPGGKSMTVKVKSIIYQPESAGELHR